MKRVSTHVLGAHTGQESVSIAGWIQTIRRLGQLTFIVLRDGAGTAQVIVPDQTILAPIEEAGALAESVIAVEGVVVEQERAAQGYELRASRITVISAVVEATPLTLSKKTLNATLPTQLDHAALALRHPTRRAAFQLSAAAMAGFRKTLTRSGYTEIQTPKIVASATEGGANVFSVDYFGSPAYLAQSPQFYKQTCVGIFEKVFEVGPVFRAEPHATARHLAEYVSMDVELGFIENHFTVMGVVKEVMAGIMAHIGAECPGALETLGVELVEVPEEIPHIHFHAAQELIEARHGVTGVVGEPDLTPQHERWLGQWAQEEFGSAFLFVTGYPMKKRPFYTHPSFEAPAFSNSFDLLFRGMELITGGQRLHLYADYLEALEAAGLSPEPFESYLEVFKYGMPPHGGFAIGLERLIMQLIGAENLRWTTLFPRDMTRLTP